MTHQAHIVTIQEPPLHNWKPPSVPFFTLLCPSPVREKDKISSCIYLNTNILDKNSFTTLPSHRGDIGSVNLFCKTSTNTHLTVTITSLYNRQLDSSTRSLSPPNIFSASDNPCLILGDFNIHSPSADPLRSLSQRELRLSQPYFDTATRFGFILLNTPGIHIRVSPDPSKRYSVIDLTFANPQANALVRKWTPLSNTSGSDHRIIAISMSLPSADFTPYQTPN
ncbi:uncharacterized protein H6S33_009890 [Morchella sextelata]|uniref:uncharacterized protein n=1 Tax=Morchella sextelata TaxID=1174677 RepID=UPI001D054C65|nr:uncharacterized protein H6S33_009890 [Morchella sextelata]KAH0602249.1 hypothetical protein H6S33_009890 [Morchella sextelata]